MPNRSVGQRITSLRSTHFAGLLALTLFGGVSLLACSCTRIPPCGEYKEYGPRFVGDVLSEHLIGARERIGSRVVKEPMRVSELRITESFSKEIEAGSMVRVVSGTGGSDCSYRFKVGGRYFVHGANTQDHLLFTDVCMGTGPIGQREVILQELRMKASNLRLPDLTGDVLQYIPREEEYPSVSNVGVRLIPVSGGDTLQALTDSRGIYRFQDLAAGTYTIELDLPRRLRSFGSSLWLNSMTVTMAKPTNGSAACHVDLWVAASGAIEGRILSPHHQHTDGLVSAYAAEDDGSLGKLINERWTEDNGSFRIQDLSAGNYWLTYKTMGRALLRLKVPIALAEAERKQHIDINSR